MFKKEDIKAGYLLEVKSKEFTELAIVNYNKRDELSFASAHFWGNIKDIDENGERRTSYVTKVYGRTTNTYLSDNNTEDRKLLWDREKEYTEYTVEEIEKLLGKKIKIKAE